MVEGLVLDVLLTVEVLLVGVVLEWLLVRDLSPGPRDEHCKEIDEKQAIVKCFRAMLDYRPLGHPGPAGSHRRSLCPSGVQISCTS